MLVLDSKIETNRQAVPFYLADGYDLLFPNTGVRSSSVALSYHFHKLPHGNVNGPIFISG